MPVNRYSKLPFRTITGLLLFLTLSFTNASAENVSQNILSVSSDPVIERITSTPRGDGLGYVIRLHTSAVIDSFVLVQPKVNLIQVLLYGNQLTLQKTSNQTLSDPLQSVEATLISVGLGLDIEIANEIPFRSRMYRDQAGSDLLIALEKTTPLELELLTDGIPQIDWVESFSTPTVVENSVSAPSELDSQSGRRGRRAQNDADARSSVQVVPPAQPSSTEDVSYSQIRNNLKFDVVVLDAGHGGHDPGSIGYGGVREKEITLRVIKKVGKYIETYLPEVKVVYTRTGDTFVELHERGSIANRAQGDLFVSIHCNAFSNRNAYGSEVFFLGLAKTDDALETMKKENSVIRFEENSKKTELTEEEILIYELANAGYLQNSQLLAGNIEYQFNERARRRSRGVKQAGFMVLYHASMPAILVELGFISNPNEAKYLSSEYGQDIMASAIFRAIRDYKVDYDASLNTLSRAK